MKKIFCLLFVLGVGLNSFAQKVTDETALSELTSDESICLSGPSNNFMIVFRGNWGKFDYARISNVSVSTSWSYVSIRNEGTPAVILSPEAFLNTAPCYTLGFVRATITVYNSNHVASKVATVQLNSIFYYDYPVNNSSMYYEYYIPNGAWEYLMVPSLPDEL
ncbi:MAG: hypothetical protein AB7S48_10810 [Bacteroidales bacterium]